MAEWSKALAWKVSIRQKRIVGSNPTRSASKSMLCEINSLFLEIRGASAPGSVPLGTAENLIRTGNTESPAVFSARNELGTESGLTGI